MVSASPSRPGPLMPSTNKDEKRFGFEGIRDIERKARAVDLPRKFRRSCRDRAHADAFAIWGVIGEFQSLQNSGLLGKSTARVLGETRQIIPHSWASSGKHRGKIFSLTQVFGAA